MQTLPPKYLKPIYMTGKNSVVTRAVQTLPVKIQQGETTTGAVTTDFTATTQSYSTGGAEAYTAGAEAFTTGTESYSAGAEAFTGGEQFTTGTESYATGTETFGAGAEFSAGAGAEDFTAGTESYAAGAESFGAGADYTTGAGAEFTTGAESFGAGAESFGAGAELGGFETTTTTTTTSFNAGTSSLGASSLPSGFKLIRRGSGISPNEQNKIATTASSVLEQGLTPVSNNTANLVQKVLGGDWLVIVYPYGKPIDFNMTCVQGNDYMYFTINETAFQVCRLR